MFIFTISIKTFKMMYDFFGIGQKKWLLHLFEVDIESEKLIMRKINVVFQFFSY